MCIIYIYIYVYIYIYIYIYIHTYIHTYIQVGGVQGDVGLGAEAPQEEEPPLDFADILRYLNPKLNHMNKLKHRRRSFTSLSF